MKLLLISLLFLLSMTAQSQPSTPSSLRTRIADDEKTLSIQIDGFTNSRKVHYDRTFDVAGMNYLQKDLLKYRAFDSVGVTLPMAEMTGLVSTALGAIAIVITLLIVGFQRFRLQG